MVNWKMFQVNALARYPTKSKNPPVITHTRLPYRFARFPVIGAVTGYVQKKTNEDILTLYRQHEKQDKNNKTGDPIKLKSM